MNDGWRCPACKSVWAPTVRGCDKCNAHTVARQDWWAPGPPLPWTPYVPYFTTEPAVAPPEPCITWTSGTTDGT